MPVGWEGVGAPAWQEHVRGGRAAQENGACGSQAPSWATIKASAAFAFLDCPFGDDSNIEAAPCCDQAQPRKIHFASPLAALNFSEL